MSMVAMDVIPMATAALGLSGGKHGEGKCDAKSIGSVLYKHRY